MEEACALQSKSQNSNDRARTYQIHRPRLVSFFFTKSDRKTYNQNKQTLFTFLVQQTSHFQSQSHLLLHPSSRLTLLPLPLFRQGVTFKTSFFPNVIFSLTSISSRKSDDDSNRTKSPDSDQVNGLLSDRVQFSSSKCRVTQT